MSFTFLFYKHIMFRKSCGKCHFANTKRPSDITIADFWGWERTNSDFNADNKGCSLVLVNTEKGRKLFEAVKDRMNTLPASVNDCLQPNLVHPTFIHPKRNLFENEYNRKGFKFVYFKYSEEGWKYKSKMIFARIKGKIKKILFRCGV